MVYDVTKMPGNWRLYGTGFRIHPVTDDLYCFLYHEFQDPTHELARISSTGELRNEYSMIQNYWFPAIPVFPDNEAPVISSAMPEDIVLPGIREEYKLYLGDKVCDEDNMSVSIVKSVITCDTPLSAFIRNDSLVLKATDPVKEGNVTLQFNSNGKLVTHDLAVSTSGDVTSNEKIWNQRKTYGFSYQGIIFRLSEKIYRRSRFIPKQARKFWNGCWPQAMRSRSDI